MTKNRRNFWIDAALFAAMLFLAATGLVMKYALPAGQGPGQGAKGEGARRYLNRAESAEPGEVRGLGRGRQRALDQEERTRPEGAGLSTAKPTWFGLDRHQFGDLHFIAALCLMALFLLHLILHWNWILCQLREFKRKPRPEKLTAETDRP